MGIETNLKRKQAGNLGDNSSSNSIDKTTVVVAYAGAGAGADAVNVFGDARSAA